MAIRLIASDLDGTLLTNKKEITKFTLEVLQKVMEQGILFVPSTGRAFQSVSENVLQIPGLRYIMCSNGAVVYELPSRTRVYECLLQKESVEKMMAIPRPDSMVMEAFIKGQPYTERRYWEDPAFYGATAFGVGYVRSTRIPVDNWNHFIFSHKKEFDSITFVDKHEELLASMRHRLDTEVDNIFTTSSLGHLLEVGHKDGGKGETLRRLLRQQRISPDEAMAFGDAGNDRSMLEAVKYAIAMQNAVEELKAIALEVTESNENDGVAKCILKYIR